MRQLALVYDWCQPVLSPQQSAALAGEDPAARCKGLLATGSRPAATASWPSSPPPTIPSTRKKLRSETSSGMVAWRICRSLADGGRRPSFPTSIALLEILHAIRDNLKIDLREDASDYFAHLPTYLIAANYPAPYRAPENEFRIPVYRGQSANPI